MKRKSSILKKIWLGAAAIGIITSLSIGIVSYIVARNSMMEEIRTKTLNTAKVAALRVDPELFDGIRPETGLDDAFFEVFNDLGDFLSDDTVAYIYTLRLDEESNAMVCVVDTDPEDIDPPGEEYEVRPEVITAYKAGRAVAPDKPYTDEWGEFYSGYAPINDKNGQTIGMVAVDCSTETVNEKLDSLTNKILVTALICLIAAAAGGWLLAKSFKALGSVAEKADEVAQGNLSVAFNYDRDDEIGAVCRTIENNNRTVKNYIDDIASRLNAIANGNLTQRSGVDYIGDYAYINTAINNLSSSLSAVFNGIKSASETVFNGAGNVFSEAEQLSGSVLKQNELIAEIVSEMKTLSEKIDINVSHTDDAKSTAKKAESAVNDGSACMEQLLDAMNDIADSSDKISNIIKTIEDIAFQTNILALNASVEASRAGAAGKGFSVVAEEVRNLAGKSSEASEQTSELILHSSNAVKRGLKVAKETSESLSEVVTRTAEIDKIISEINEDCREQHSCVEDINIKIDNVSGYVNSSAANAEKNTNTSEELSGQAASLNEILKRFHMLSE